MIEFIFFSSYADVNRNRLEEVMKIGILESINKRVGKFSLIDVKLTQATAILF